jgi:hypothetical protein
MYLLSILLFILFTIFLSLSSMLEDLTQVLALEIYFIKLVYQRAS